MSDTGETPAMDELVLVGEITAPFGIRGEVKMRPLMDAPELLSKLPGVRLRYPNDPKRADESRKIAKVRPGQPGVLVRFADVADRNTSETLRGAYVLIRKSELPPLQEDAYYESDLIGLNVVTESGRDMGVVERVLFLPANDVYETPIAMIPAIGDVIVTIDVAGGKMIVRDIPGLRRDEL